MSTTGSVSSLLTSNAISARDAVRHSHLFHYIIKNGLVYLCMAEGSFGRRIPFMFLEDIMAKWTEIYGDRGTTALAYGMNEDFARVLQRQVSSKLSLFASCLVCNGLSTRACTRNFAPQMNTFSRQSELITDSRVGRVAGEVEEVRQVMVENIDRYCTATPQENMDVHYAFSHLLTLRTGFLNGGRKSSSLWTKLRI